METALQDPPSSHPPRELTPSLPGVISTRQGALRVLVVDDNADLNQMLCDRLSRLGFEVEGVSSGEAALERVGKGATDLVFLDVSLPGIDGLEVLAQIRRSGLDAAVIVTTAFGSEDIAADALRRGADDYMPKTAVTRDLEAILERTASRLKLNRQNAQLRRQLDEKRALLEDELGRAARVQAELLPSEQPHVPGFEMAARCIPAHEVGGDFYDWHLPAPDTLTLTLCDVMGKGMPAALLMATVRATLRAVVRRSPPALAMHYVVSALSDDLDRSGSLVTMFLAQLDLPRRKLHFVDAGHGHVFMRRASGEIELLTPRGLPLGVLDDAKYEEGELTFSPGDALVIYSDGLVDVNPRHSLVPGELAAGLENSQSASAMVERLLQIGAPDQGPPPDDLTVVVLRCTG